MNTDTYLIYPEAREKLRGIEERIKDAKKHGKIGYVNDHPFEDELIWMSSDIAERGYIKNINRELAKKHLDKLNSIFTNQDKASWKVATPGKESTKPVDRKDIAVLMGHYASLILEPHEMRDYEKYGFPGPFEFAGTVGALLLNIHNLESHSGLKWEATRPDGTKYINEITGDMNCDLRIFQVNQTPYETTDPVGNKALYRPYMDSDISIVAGYHSTEGELLVSVMKYAEQTGIDIKGMLYNPELEEYRRGTAIATCTEHFGGFDRNPREYFVTYDKPLLRMDEIGKVSGRCFDYVLQSHMYGESQCICMTHDGTLAFGYEKDGHVDVRARFMPSEIENILRGIVYQCAKHLGRTSLKQIADIIEYKYSQKFKDDMKEIRRFYSRQV